MNIKQFNKIKENAKKNNTSFSDAYKVKDRELTNDDKEKLIRTINMMQRQIDNTFKFKSDASKIKNELLNILSVAKNSISSTLKNDSIKDDYANELLAFSKELDKNDIAYTTNQEIAKAYQKNTNPHMKFKVTKEGDKYKVEVINRKNDSIHDVDPREGESKSDFIARFMNETKSEYPNEKQRYAVANSYWNKKGKDSIKDNISLPTEIDEEAIYQCKNNEVIGVSIRNGKYYFTFQKGGSPVLLDKNNAEKLLRSYQAYRINDSIKDGNLANSKLRVGQIVHLDQSKIAKKLDADVLNDDYIVEGFYINQKLVKEDLASEEYRDFNGIKIRGKKSGVAMDVNRFQLQDSIKDSGELTAKTIESLEELIKQYQRRHPKMTYSEIFKRNGLYRVKVDLNDSIKDGIALQSQLKNIVSKYTKNFNIRVNPNRFLNKYEIILDIIDKSQLEKIVNEIESKISNLRNIKYGIPYKDESYIDVYPNDKISDSKIRDYKYREGELMIGQTVLYDGYKTKILDLEWDDKFGYDILLTDKKGRKIWVGDLVQTIRGPIDSIQDEDIEELSKEEQQAIEDYKKAISGTKDVKLLELYSHILREEIEHLRELNEARTEDSVKDEKIYSILIRKNGYTLVAKYTTKEEGDKIYQQFKNKYPNDNITISYDYMYGDSIKDEETIRYKGYYIYKFGNQYRAISKDKSSFDFTGNSIEEVKAKIDKIVKDSVKDDDWDFLHKIRNHNQQELAKVLKTIVKPRLYKELSDNGFKWVDIGHWLDRVEKEKLLTALGE